MPITNEKSIEKENMNAANMSLETAIKERRSVRGFLDKPVPEQIMREIFELARLAPSNCNIQPWRVFVASGATRDELSNRLLERVKSGTELNPDHPYPTKMEGIYRERQVDCAVALYGNIGVERNDSAGRAKASLRNYELFDAPHVCFIGMDRDFGVTVALDVGMYIQNLMLAMTAYGLASCAQGSLRYYPDDIREIFNEPDNTSILVGLSFGYEDTTEPANKTVVGRASLDENHFFKL